MSRRPTEYYCAAALAGMLVCSSALQAQPVELHLYLAASPQHDAAVVAEAREAEGEVTVQGRAAARWVPLREPPDPADDWKSGGRGKCDPSIDTLMLVGFCCVFVAGSGRAAV
ncbi:MAG: hypothetical protein RBS80_03055 [Thermoguttaceae bacterium]|nr:hypothetical protein [Thermoguttaceae bacterium]